MYWVGNDKTSDSLDKTNESEAVCVSVRNKAILNSGGFFCWC